MLWIQTVKEDWLTEFTVYNEISCYLLAASCSKCSSINALQCFFFLQIMVQLTATSYKSTAIFHI